MYEGDENILGWYDFRGYLNIWLILFLGSG